MNGPAALKLGLGIALTASLAGASRLPAATATCRLDAGSHPSVAYVFGQVSDPSTCSAELISGCAATLVSPTVAVTSGDCAITWGDPTPFTVTAKYLAFSDEHMIGCGQVARIASFFVHPQHVYGEADSPFNIGAIVLEEPIGVTPASLPAAGDLASLRRGDLLEVVSPGFVGPQTDAARNIGQASFFRIGDSSFLVRSKGNTCVPSFDGGGVFLPGGQDLVGLIVGGTSSVRQRKHLRLDTLAVRDFLADLVPLP